MRSTRFSETALSRVRSRRVLELLLAAGANLGLRNCVREPVWEWIQDPDLAEEVRRLTEPG
jgi:hypothetical protein